MKRVLIALSLMMLMMPAALMAAGLPNPGFEYGFGADGVAIGWNTYAMWEFPTCSISTDAYSGSFSQAVFNAGEGGIYAQMSTKPGIDYTVSVWAKTIGGCQGFMTVDWDGGTDPSPIDWSLWAFTTQFDTWELLTLTGTATGTTATVFFDVYGGTVLFDEFSPAAPAPVPEPSSFLALGTGLIGLAGVIRRRK